MATVEDPLSLAFRRRVRATIEADLAREEADGKARQEELLPALRQALERARQEGRCTRAWLFGSFAWGVPTERSDVDLLVEGCENPDALAGAIWRVVERPVHVVERETAPESLVERALAEGLPL